MAKGPDGQGKPSPVRRPDGPLILVVPEVELREHRTGHVADPDVVRARARVDLGDEEPPGIEAQIDIVESAGRLDRAGLAARAVEPDEAGRTRVAARRQNSVVGRGERAGAGQRVVPDLQPGRDGISQEPHLPVIEGLREQVPVPRVQQVAGPARGPGGDVLRSRTVLDERLCLSVVEARQTDVSLLLRPGPADIEKVTPIRKELGPCDRGFLPRRVWFQHRLRRAAAVSDEGDACPSTFGEQDRVPAAPGALGEALRSVADGHGRPARDVGLLQLSLREESHETAVRRPEGARGSLRAWKRDGARLGNRTNPEGRPAVRAARGKRDRASVGSDREEVLATNPGEPRPQRRMDGETDRHRRRVRWSGAQKKEEGEHRGGKKAGGGETDPPSVAGRRTGFPGFLRAAASDPPELEPDVGRALPAELRILGETGLHHPIERRRRRRLDRRNGSGFRRHDRGDQARLTFSPERFSPRCHLVERRAEGEDVRPRIGLLRFELLGRHVRERAENRSFAGYFSGRGRDRCEALARRFRFEHFRQSEIEQLHAALRQHDVAGLQVPVDDSLPVRLVERVGDLTAVAQRLLEGQRPLHQPVRERLALQIFHDEELDAVLVAHVVEGADVGVRELRDRLRLPLEALAHLGRG